jgi:hypothetical protein
MQEEYSNIHCINMRIIDIMMHIAANTTHLDEHVSVRYNTRTGIFNNIHTIL